MGGDAQVEDDGQLALIDDFSCSDESAESVKRNGSLRSAVAHIITGVIGAGVMSLSWSVAQLGWIAGPVLLIVFPAVTLVSATLLSECYRYPDPEFGPIRIRSYSQAVKLHLGEKREKICGALMVVGFWMTGIAYHITTAGSIRAIQKLICYHREGHEASCTYEDGSYMVMFGAVQIILSQIPNLHDLEWLSLIATITSFCYSTIGFSLGFAQVLENGSIKGGITGAPAANMSEKLWSVFEALGDIAFAYPYTTILLEIQDTLKSPPSEGRTIKKASAVAVAITTFFYIGCGCFGYAAFGDATPGNLLTGVGFYEPYWLLGFANACVVVHLLGGYQIYSQLVFSMAERWLSRNFPNSAFVNNHFTLQLPSSPALRLRPSRLCFRTAYVLSTTVCAMLFPYFNQVLGLLGALNFWPLTIYFPVEMYIKQRKIEAWSKTWVLYKLLSFVCFLVTVMAFVGSFERMFSAKFR